MTLDRPASRLAIPVHLSIGFANTWTFHSDVLLRAIKNHGGIGTEACRRRLWRPTSPMAARRKATASSFIRQGHELAGQNAQAYPVVM